MSTSQSLTDTQLVLLSQASQHYFPILSHFLVMNRLPLHHKMLPEGKIVPQGHLRGGVFQRVLASLAGRGLVQPAPLCSDEQASQADGEQAPACLVISPAGLAALGIMVDGEGDGTSEASALGNHPAQGLEPEFTPDPKPDIKADLAPQSSAGDDSPADPAIPDLAEADPVYHLPQQPRAASKQAQVLELLAQPEGVTLDTLMAATGWLPHTTRAVLSGLRKRGHAIQRLPGGEGGGSRYRLTAPASPDAPANSSDSHASATSAPAPVA